MNKPRGSVQQNCNAGERRDRDHQNYQRGDELSHKIRPRGHRREAVAFQDTLATVLRNMDRHTHEPDVCSCDAHHDCHIAVDEAPPSGNSAPPPPNRSDE